MPADPFLDDPVAAGLAAFLPILDVTAAYRDAAAARGFSPTAAEMMAVSYHDLLADRVFTLADEG